jgi:hypothetical protein
VIWFTLGNISVVGTYTHSVHNLTPRGLLAVTAAAVLLSCAAVAAVPYCRNWPRVGYPIGGLPLYIFSPLYLINHLQLQLQLYSSRPILAASLQLSQLAASCQLAAIAAAILSRYSQLTVMKLLP